jgi:xanthine dehydrogenase YagR molybdenum-binding subunit
LNYQPQPTVPHAAENMGKPEPRYEARAKVTGKPLYAADQNFPGERYAYLLTSVIAKGKIVALNLDEAAALPGVIKIYTHENIPAREAVRHLMAGGPVSDSVLPMSDSGIHYYGQIIAVAVASSFEAAREAAHRIKVTFAEEPAASGIDRAGVEIASGDVEQTGDVEAGLAAAAAVIDAEYTTPTQHHNAMELFSTTALWEGDSLTLHEPSQFVRGLRGAVAMQLKMDPAKIRIINPFLGGAFGGKGLLTQRTAIVAVIARELGVPVKLVVGRDQGFTVATYRAETKHHVRLGADSDGKLTAYGHEGWELTSRADVFLVEGNKNAVEMYACPNIWTRVNAVHADRNTPGFMRSPPEVPYMFALESAMDELAVALKMDPVELRRINDTQFSPVTGVPYTSRSLMKCFDAAAESFGWARRNPTPMSMREGDWQVGYGCATAVYPTQMMPAAARVSLTAGGKALVQIAAHEVGQGAYSVFQQLAAEWLNLPMGAVEVQMGDSDLPAGPIAGGSMTTASAGSAVHLACQKLAARFGNAMPAFDELQTAFDRLGVASVEEYAEYLPPGATPEDIAAVYKGQMAGRAGGVGKKQLMFAFGANFVEVRVHRLTREIRVPRMTGAFAAGRIVNPRTARSQYLGGMIWGVASALLEATERDALRGRYINDNIAEYLIAVNADVPKADIIMIPEIDHEVNPLGVKGIGEISNVGMNAAIANAVYHATGKRIRDLPITLDKLLG